MSDYDRLVAAMKRLQEQHPVMGHVCVHGNRWATPCPPLVVANAMLRALEEPVE